MTRRGQNSAAKPWSRAAIAFVAAASLALGACGGDDKPEEDGGGDGGGGGDVSVPDTPDAVVNQFAASVAANKIGDAVALLPESYQKDINGLISEFGNSMDPELWNSITGLGKDIGTVLTDKKDIIMGSKMFKGMDETGEMGKSYDSMAKAFSEMFGSDALTLESLKKGDARALLNGPLNGLMKNANLLPERDLAMGIETIGKLKAETVSTDGDTAIVRITMDGQDPEEVPFKKVDGRWVPAPMADEWGAGIAEMKENMASLKSPEFAQQKMGMTIMIGMVKGVVDQLKGASSSDEIDQKIGSLMQMLGGGGAGGDGPPPGF